MASRRLAFTDPRRLTVDEFLEMRFPEGVKAELQNGEIQLMGGGSTGHARVQMNLYRYLGAALRGSGCRPYGSDAAIEAPDDTLRYPDLTIACGPQLDEDARVLVEPRVVMEVLSPSTRALDEGAKLAEYRSLASVETIMLVDPAAERVRVVHRLAPEEWNDRVYAGAEEIPLPQFGIVLPLSEIFARD